MSHPALYLQEKSKTKAALASMESFRDDEKRIIL